MLPLKRKRNLRQNTKKIIGLTLAAMVENNISPLRCVANQ